MLISPPFLPPRGETQNENDWLSAAMLEGKPGDGAFPVSFNLGWHGGVHLTAPLTAGKSEPVRAISDGKVVFLRKPTSRVSSQDHPLNYRGGWTDDGCVVIRHQTCIGCGANASDICFFSIYMHLAEIDPRIRTEKAISRKDVIGYAGQIYGSLARQIHFEIVSDDNETKKILGRLSGDVDVTKDGRLDAVYGDIFFHLPAGTCIYETEPIKHLVAAQFQPGKPNKKSPLPPIVALQPALVTSEAMVVGISSHPNMGLQHGDVRITSYELNGKVVGKFIEEELRDYRIISEAEKLSKSMRSSGLVAPSAVLEMLKFGRIVNVENENAPTGEAPHWRLVPYMSGNGWVNLNAANVRKFSSADFPQWCGWTIVDDSADRDSRCDSKIIKSWAFGKNAAPNLQQGIARLSQSEVTQKLRRTICKFPSEWASETIDARWSWLRQSSPMSPNPLSQGDFERLRLHIVALCFNVSLVHEAQWHWPPLEFIRQFRTCGWLSELELVRCIPAAYQMEKAERGSSVCLIKISDDVATQRVKNIGAVPLMQICRKYGIVTPTRQAHFFAQIFRETGLLQWVEERGSGQDYERSSELGNDNPGDGKRYKGRGLIQVTGGANYRKYSSYRGQSFLVEPQNTLISSNQYNSADTAGLFWISRPVGNGMINLSFLADRGLAEDNLRSVTKMVNGAEDGKKTALLERRSYLKILTSILKDDFPVISPLVERRYG